jgi:hypothetical protein
MNTPTPWKIYEVRDENDNNLLVGGEETIGGIIDDENAAFIIKAVNAHETLVRALEEIAKLESGHDSNCIGLAKEALSEIK